MQLPSYWLPRPPMDLSPETRASFDELLDGVLAGGAGGLIEYTLSAPKWQFLCYAAEERGLVLHGSGDAAIARFEPRQPRDLRAFGAQRAVYAAADGIWPMYFAIVDRARVPTTLVNACVRIIDASGKPGQAYYVFSISKEALAQRAYRSGAVYLLPREGFIAEPPVALGEVWFQVAQLACPTPVTPLAVLPIAPEDFPFLDAMRGHDESRIAAYAEAMNTGAPWPDDAAP